MPARTTPVHADGRKHTRHFVSRTRMASQHADGRRHTRHFVSRFRMASQLETVAAGLGKTKRTRRAQGELGVLRHRLEALSREKENVTEGASAKVEELEAKVLDGELQRRKMHNLIQVRCGGERIV